MVHYVPASLENITEVVAYVLNEQNGEEMNTIVAAANSWCKKMNTKLQLSKEAVTRIHAFEVAMYESYNSSWIGEWDLVRTRIFNNVGNDLESCVLGKFGFSFGSRALDFLCSRSSFEPLCKILVRIVPKEI